jgi:hypothetical protein
LLGPAEVRREPGLPELRYDMAAAADVWEPLIFRIRGDESEPGVEMVYIVNAQRACVRACSETCFSRVSRSKSVLCQSGGRWPRAIGAEARLRCRDGVVAAAADCGAERERGASGEEGRRIGGWMERGRVRMCMDTMSVQASPGRRWGRRRAASGCCCNGTKGWMNVGCCVLCEVETPTHLGTRGSEAVGVGNNGTAGGDR